MEKLPVSIIAVILAIIIVIAGCSLFGKKKEIKPFVSEVVHPDWSVNAVFYEVNVRQYTDSGTFKAFEKHLPRLKALGVDVLWFMPTYPIGVLNRKQGLGSYYSVKDYMGVNPEFGTAADFKEVINKAHALGMHVILDWIPNHSSWDNPLAVEHPDWYVKDSTGNFIPPIGFDWTDVIQLDWSKKGLQDYMLKAMKYWVEFGADGFRVDHPHETPPEFWERARVALDSIKPVMLLAEHEGKQFVRKGFDMNYAWEMHHLMNSIAQGKDSAIAMSKYFKREMATFPPNVYRMMFLTNHDENSWAGTIDSLMGDSQKMFATLIFTAQGVPLIYSGQEVCLDRKLKFFVKDSVKWDSCYLTGFYRGLVRLKHQNKALRNGESGGRMMLLKTNRDRKVFAFYREKDDNRVIVFLNLTKKPVSFKPDLKSLGSGEYTEYFSGQKAALPSRDAIQLDPWGYKVFIK